jgi:hypothetical protein
MLRIPHTLLCSFALAFLTTEKISVAQAGEDCVVYQSAVSRSALFPDRLLAADWPNAIRCLALVLDDLKGPIERKATADTWAQFVRATAMIRIILANNERKEVSQNETAIQELRKQSEPPNPAIQEFRKYSTLDAASSLAYGARTEDDNARLNGTLVLGNVVDNQSVCVVLDHLYDPEFGPNAASYHVRGRANLLGVASVVAPWAYKENYTNIMTLWRYMSDTLEALKERTDLKQTFDILNNIKIRLDFQDEAERKHQEVNKNKSLKERGLDACKYYRPKWAGDRLKY